MEITLQDIITKYPTNIKLENMSKKLRNKVLFGGNNDYYKQFGNITTDDIKKPEHNTNNEYESYTYNIKDITLEIEYKPDNYRTMEITIRKPTPEEVPEPYFIWHYNYNGESDRVY